MFVFSPLVSVFDGIEHTHVANNLICANTTTNKTFSSVVDFYRTIFVFPGKAFYNAKFDINDIGRSFALTL